MIKSVPSNASFKSHMSFGRKIGGRKVLQHLGPVFSSQKAKVNVFKGGLNSQLEAGMDAGLELLYDKAKKMGGNGVINISLKVTHNTPYYLIWGDAVALDIAPE